VPQTLSVPFTLAVKYVRRELRSLTENDRRAFFDALYQVYTGGLGSGGEGSGFGDKFKTAEYFLYKHLNGAGTSDCDHWHDGAGIITHHTAFTLEMEQSLQAVDPSVAMPYWGIPHTNPCPCLVSLFCHYHFLSYPTNFFPPLLSPYPCIVFVSFFLHGSSCFLS
jgi:hypothetical protein